MFSCRAFTETKQRRLYFQAPLLSDNCGAFRNHLGRAIAGGFKDLPLGPAACKGVDADLSISGLVFITSLYPWVRPWMFCPWGTKMLKKSLPCPPPAESHQIKA